jgi:hypothetical protein
VFVSDVAVFGDGCDGEASCGVRACAIFNPIADFGSRPSVSSRLEIDSRVLSVCDKRRKSYQGKGKQSRPMAHAGLLVVASYVKRIKGQLADAFRSRKVIP